MLDNLFPKIDHFNNDSLYTLAALFECNIDCPILIEFLSPLIESKGEGLDSARKNILTSEFVPIYKYFLTIYSSILLARLIYMRLQIIA